MGHPLEGGGSDEHGQGDLAAEDGSGEVARAHVAEDAVVEAAAVVGGVVVAQRALVARAAGVVVVHHLRQPLPRRLFVRVEADRTHRL